MLTGIQTIKGMGVEDRTVQNWSNLYVDVLNVSLERGRLEASVEALFEHPADDVPAGAPAGGDAARCSSGGCSWARCWRSTRWAWAFSPPSPAWWCACSRLQLVGSYLERVDDVLECTRRSSRRSDHAGPHELQGGIRLDNVSFRYGPLAPLVLQDVSLEI